MGICSSDMNKIAAINAQLDKLPDQVNMEPEKKSTHSNVQDNNNKSSTDENENTERLIETQRRDKHQLPLRKRQVFLYIILYSMV